MQDASIWLAGVQHYHESPTPPVPSPVPVAARFANAQVLDYGGPDAAVPLVLLVPSLINRAHILDLLPDNSFTRRLAKHYRVWLLDWGEPTDAAVPPKLDDYLRHVLLPVLALAQASCRPVYVLGYCMGGLLALAAAALQPQQVQKLALLATPWDFGQYPLSVRLGLLQMMQGLWPTLALGQPLSVDALQALFTLLQPLAVYDKFKKIGATTSAGDDLFVAVEDWLNDGVPLAAPVAQTCLHDWFLLNTTGHGQWQVLDQPIKPELVTVPTLLLVPQHDSVVPAAASAALAVQLPHAQMQTLPTGHIGMIVGRNHRDVTVQRLQEFFAA